MAVAQDEAAAVAQIVIPRQIEISSLPTFGLDPADDITEFFVNYEITIEFYELTDELKAKLLTRVLKDRALTFYRTLAADVRANYHNLKQALTDEFDVPQIKYRKRQLLHQISQHGEPISTYLSRLEKLAQNLNVPDQTKLDIMIAGLDSGYRNYLQMKQPETYREATHALLLKEAVDPPMEYLIEDLMNQIKHIKTDKEQGDCEQSVVCFICKEEGHISRYCPIKYD
uniref:CCHC-type domain-containing protein n=1 Tax=Clytia hemisphaerica TaxID=252671 RepID=A0A7M5UZW9_9CNID